MGKTSDRKNVKKYESKEDMLVEVANVFMNEEEILEDEWLVTAIKELAEEEDLEAEDYDISESDYGLAKSVTLDGNDYTIVQDDDEAQRVAEDYVKEMLEDEPELFSPDWLQNHIYISDTDKRLIANDMSDMYYDMDDDEVMERYADEKNIDIDELDEEDVDTYKDELSSDYSDGVESQLDDPIEYFVNQEGIYSIEDLMQQSFINIDTEAAAEEAVSTDGRAHFLSHYDGNEIELPSGAIAYRTN